MYSRVCSHKSGNCCSSVFFFLLARVILQEAVIHSFNGHVIPFKAEDVFIRYPYKKPQAHVLCDQIRTLATI